MLVYLLVNMKFDTTALKYYIVHSPLFFREIVDVDRSVRPGRHLGLLMQANWGENKMPLGRGGGVNNVG